MKVPHQILGRTRPSGQGMAPLQVQVDPDAFGASIGTGLQNLSQGLKLVADRGAQRAEKLDRFQSMSNFSDFEVMVNGKLSELKKTADPTGKGFTESANKAYDIAADEFIAKMVPPDMQMEARYWTSNTRQRIIGDAMQFEYQAGTAYFKAGVDKQYQRALTALDPKLGGDPKRLEAEKANLFRLIDEGTDLLPPEKEEMKRNIAIGLESVGYKEAKKASISHGDMNIPGDIGNIIDSAALKYGVDPGVMRRIAWLESRGNPNAKNDVSSAAGLFQQTDANARDYGVTNKFDPVQSAEGGAKFAAKNIPFFRQRMGRDPEPWEIYLMHQQGPQGAVNLLSYGDRPATDVVGGKQITDNGGRVGMTAREFAGIWEAKYNGVSSSDIDNNPAFANVPYEQRMALTQDAEAQYVAEENARIKAQVDANNAAINALKVGVFDGTKGMSDIEKARDDGVLTDFSDIKAVTDLYEQRNAEQIAARAGASYVTGETQMNSSDPENVKNLNSFFKPGLEAIQNLDKNVISTGLVPIGQSTGDFPTDAMGLLSSMARSIDQNKAMYAFDALAQLEEANPDAYKLRIPDEIEADVAFVKMRRNEMTEEQLFEELRGGPNSVAKRGRAVLRDEAKKNLAQEKDGVSALSQKVAEVRNHFNNYITSDPTGLSTPGMAKAMSFDFDTAYTTSYMKFGDDAAASQYAADYVMKNYGVEGGSNKVMKHPPENYLPKALGDHSWIERQARQELQLQPDWSYELVPDERTDDEVNKHKLNSSVPVSWQVARIDPSGTPHPVMNEAGGMVITDIPANVPMRIFFVKPPALTRVEEIEVQVNQIDSELKEIMSEIPVGENVMEAPIPEVHKQQWDELIGERARLLQEQAPLMPEVLPRRKLLEREGKPTVIQRGGQKPLGFDIIRSLFDNGNK